MFVYNGIGNEIFSDKNNESVAELRAQANEVDNQLDQLETTSEAAWQDMATGIVDALEELETAYQDAASEFESPS